MALFYTVFQDIDHSVWLNLTNVLLNIHFKNRIVTFILLGLKKKLRLQNHLILSIKYRLSQGSCATSE